jgi:hypothetical protein
MTLTLTEYDHLGINSELMPPVAPLRDMVKTPVVYSAPEYRNVAKKRRAAQNNTDGLWRPKHTTKMTSRSIPVDEKIASLIEILWAIGFETQFSCEGDVDLFDETGSLENLTDASHIVFPRTETAVIFMEYSYRFLIDARPDLPWANLVNLELMLPTKDIHNIRAIVRFNPAALKSLTEYWKTSLIAHCQPKSLLLLQALNVRNSA